MLLTHKRKHLNAAFCVPSTNCPIQPTVYGSRPSKTMGMHSHGKPSSKTSAPKTPLCLSLTWRINFKIISPHTWLNPQLNTKKLNLIISYVIHHVGEAADRGRWRYSRDGPFLAYYRLWLPRQNSQVRPFTIANARLSFLKKFFLLILTQLWTLNVAFLLR